MKKEVSGESDCRWEEFQRYATDRLKTPVTIMGLVLQRMDGAQDEEERREALEMAKRGQQNLEQAIQEELDTTPENEEGMKMKRNRKRLWVLLLSAVMIVTQLPAVAMAENSVPEDGTIASFEPLDSSVANQTVEVGTELSGLNLPDEVTATVYHVTEDTIIPDDDNTEEENGDSSTATPSEAKDSVSGNNAGDSSTKDSGKTVTTVTTSDEEIPVTWDSKPAYDGSTEGKYVFTADVDGYALSGSAKLPQITVTVTADISENPTENPPAEPAPCTKTEGCTLADGHEGECVITPPANDALVKTITDWTFVDDENLNEGVLPLINVSMEHQADFDTVVSMLPTQISAEIENEEEPAKLDITGWACPEYIQDGDDNWPLTGAYTFTAALIEGYACDPLPTAKVLLGGANTFDANNTITEGGLTVTASDGGEVEYTVGSGFTLKATGTYEISGEWIGDLTGVEAANKKAVITVPDSVTADVTLNAVTINVGGTDYACAFTVDEAGGTANLTLQGTNTLTSGWTRAGLEVPEAAKVTIKGDGSLTASGGKYTTPIAGGSGAGIGGGNGQNGGTILIESGTVIANGGGCSRQAGGASGGAGIGGGTGKDGGTITIQGGSVTANGGTGTEGHGAGIGGGGKTIDGSEIIGNGGIITIENSKIEVSGGSYGESTGGAGGAGIGGGASGSCETITINDSKITATGSTGIGGGYGGNGGIIHIINSEIEATGVYAGAGIGGGDSGNGGTITIENSKIKAAGGEAGHGMNGGAGIGGGNQGNGGTITIENSEIEATGGGTNVGGAGIGGGLMGSGETITIKNSRVKAKGNGDNSGNNSGAGIGGGGTISNPWGGTGGSSGTITIKNSEIEAEGGYCAAGIGTGGGYTSPGVSVGIITIEGGVITATAKHDGAGIGGGRGVSSDGKITITGGARVIASSITPTTEYSGYSGAGIGGSEAGRGVTVTISGAGTKVTATGFDGGFDVGSGKGSSIGGSLSVTDGAVLEMKSIGTNAADPEYKNCTIIDKNGIPTHYNEHGNKIAETPAITIQPQDHTVNAGGSVTLSVAASVTDGGTISYQWYSNAENKTTGGTPVGANSASYSPPTDTAGTVYYYVIATNTNHGTAVTAASNTAKVIVNSLTNAETPAITEQPQSGTYTQNASTTLTVTANVSDGGNLTYQWYSNTTNSNAGGSAISGAGTASYTVPTGTAGTTYYYVVITNTNNGVDGNKTATAASNTAAVTVTAAGGSTGGGGGSSYTAPDPKSSYTVTGDKISQTISRSDLKKLADSGKSLTLRCDKASMTFEPAALKAILAAVPATAGSITFAADPADLSAFPDAAAQIGTRPAHDFAISYKASKRNPVVVPVNFPAGSASISLNYTPAAAEVTGSLFMVYVDGKGAVTWLDKSSYDNGKVLAEVPHFSTYGVAYKAPAPVFTDIANHWAKADIEFVAARGLLSGTGNNLFSPDGTMTRGMFATALGRLAGIDPAQYKNTKFSDVAATAYYAPYVAWAAEKGIVNGTTDTTFAPDTNISREQMAVIMQNYAKTMGYTVPKTREAVPFADNGSIESWAKDAVKAMQMAGVMNGKDGNRFDPKASATRAEVSAVLRRFVEIVIDPATAGGWEKNDSGHWLYYKDGKALTGWQTIGRLRYYFNGDGVMHEDWKQDTSTNKWYYWTNAGAATGWKEIGGKWYYFDENGVMAVNAKIDGYEVGPDGARK